MPIESYEDLVEYEEEVVEAAFRNGSVEVNISKSRVFGVRVFYRGVWCIVSVQSNKKPSIKELKMRAYKRLKRSKVKTKPSYLADARQYKGKFKVGREASVEELEDLLDKVLTRILSGEVVVSMYKSTKKITSDLGECIGENVYYEVLIYPSYTYGGRVFTGSSSIAYTGSIRDLREKHVEGACNEALERLNAKVNSKRISPFLRGKNTVILDSEASAAFFHEVSHLLEGDRPDSLPRGQRISTRQLSIYDEPRYPWSPSYTLFDDEAVETSRKALVEDGEVLERLHTRESSWNSIDESPGNSRGLFHKPKALHRTLLVHPGDWRDEEIVEETKKGLLVKGVVRAELFKNAVSIIPEATWTIEKGEIKEPVLIREVLIPLLTGLTNITAMGKRLKMRHSYEKGHVIAELAPSIRVEAYIF